MRVTPLLRAGLAVLAACPVRAWGQEDSVFALRMEAEPVLSIGLLEGREAYQLYDVDGAARLPDGSVVAGVRGAHEVRRFGPDGTHRWTFGRFGEGPGEFQQLQLLPSCTNNEAVVVYDRRNRQVTVLDGQGEMIASYPLTFEARAPYGRIVCSPGGRMVFAGWGEGRVPSAGPYRWSVDVVFTDGGGGAVQLLRGQVPGADRVMYFENGVPLAVGPRTWSRGVSLAAADGGVWLGTGDEYEVEFVEWTGITARRIRWMGPDLSVARGHVAAHRDDLLRRYRPRQRSDPDWRPRFEELWAEEEDVLPNTFPAYARFLMVDGDLWVQSWPRPGEADQHWLVFEVGGTLTARLELPSDLTVSDAGRDWLLVHMTDALGVERLAVHEVGGR